MLSRFGGASLIYIATNFLQKGTAFLLLPLYTKYLSPSDYGVIAIVTALNGVLATLFTLALPAAITRYYFQLRDKPDELRDFIGTVLISVLVVSAVCTMLALVFGPLVLKPALGNVDFWPYVALGVGTTAFQPTLTALLSLLQSKGAAVRYAAISLAQFFVVLALTITFVVGLRSDARGPLQANFIGSVIFFFLSLCLLRRDFNWRLRPNYLRAALKYSLPQIPHTMSGQVTTTVDRFLVNTLMNSAAAGLYSVGSMFGLVIETLCQSANRAYVPMSMDILTRKNPNEYSGLADLGLVLVVICCTLGAAVSAFSVNLVHLLTASEFDGSSSVVPFVVFAGVASGIYYVLVNALFFDLGASRLVSVGTVVGAIANVALNVLLIPWYGIAGAAAAAMLAQIAATTLVSFIAKPYDPIPWARKTFVVAFVACAVVGFILARMELDGLILDVIAKLFVLTVLFMLLNWFAWRDSTYSLRIMFSLIAPSRRLPKEPAN